MQSWRLHTHPSFSHIQTTNRDYKLVELFLLQTEMKKRMNKATVVTILRT